jgi:hypothetical protein
MNHEALSPDLGSQMHMSGETSVAPHRYEILFGAECWQSHLGGGFHGPEEGDTFSWNWLSDKQAWCVLPPLSLERDYRVRIEAAPVAFYEKLLWEFRVDYGDKTLSKIVFPVDSHGASLTFSLPELFRQSAARANHRFIATVRQLPPPCLTLTINGLPLEQLHYDPVPHVQPREFTLRHELLSDRNVMFFQANYALSQRDADPSSNDDRLLSFRMYRMFIEELA